LKIDRERAQLLDRIQLQQRLAFDHDQHVVLARWKFVRNLLVLFEFHTIRAEQLAERIVDLDPFDAQKGRERQQRRDDYRHQRRAQRQESKPLDAERDCEALLVPWARRPGYRRPPAHDDSPDFMGVSASSRADPTSIGAPQPQSA